MNKGDKTATQIGIEANMRQDFRYHRATHLAARVLNVLGGVVDDRREAYDRLVEAFRSEGWDVISDEDRAKLGLPPRDGKGWTADEVLEYHRRMSNAMRDMTRPIMVQVDKPKHG